LSLLHKAVLLSLFHSRITCVITGIIAVSCGEGLSFDDRVDNFSRILMTSSLVLIWSFSDPIHPRVGMNYINFTVI